MTVAIDDLEAAQTNGNEETMEALIHLHLLNYAATHPDAKIRYYSSGMVLHVHSNGSCLSLSKAKSRAGGHYYLSDHCADPSKAKPNGAIHIL